MSWFNLALHGKQVWDSHSFVNGLITGGVIGKIVVDHGLKKTRPYPFIREKISLYVATYFCDKLDPYNKAVATKILVESFNKETMNITRNALKDRLSKMSKEDLIWLFSNGVHALKNASYSYFDKPKLIVRNAYSRLINWEENKESMVLTKNAFRDRLSKMSKEDLKSFLNNSLHVLKNASHNYLDKPTLAVKKAFLSLINKDQEEGSSSYQGSYEKELTSQDLRTIVQNASNTKENKQMLIKLLKEFKWTEFTCNAVIFSLQPSCEKAVKAAVTSAAKISFGLSLDLALKKTITIVALPILYGLTKTMLQASTDYLPDSQWTDVLAEGVGYLPSISTVISVSAGVHLGFLSYLFWQTVRHSPTYLGDDKENIKKLVIYLSKDSIVRKIDGHSLFKTLGIELDAAAKDRLAIQLIGQAVQIHWPKLTRTKFLGIPLATEPVMRHAVKPTNK